MYLQTHVESREVHISGHDEKLTEFSILLVATTASLAMRFWARKRSAQRFMWDDWLALAAWVLFAAYVSTLLRAADEGLNVTEPKKMKLMDLIYALKLVYVGSLLSAGIITFARLSVICLYFRIFGLYKTFTRALWINGVFTVIWGITCVFLLIFRCTPIEHAWNVLKPGTCIDINLLLVILESLNLTMDISLLLLPIMRIRTLQLSIRDRLGLCIVFLTGAFVCVTSILRIVFCYHLDPTQSTFWLVLQLAFAVICSNLPTLRSFLPKRATIPKPVRSLMTWRSQQDPVEDSGKSSKGSDTSGGDMSTGEKEGLSTVHIMAGHLNEEGRWKVSNV
ncbi:hypothetical protein P154DRAFT_560937 [Amniculicola lignicola CBS 123094]|uniref:Rhodopsin domain-containing protein n=1 Tax=Amniculicola lignicola CBS 123094 TaxID=1392246 RepID=A0A6A5WTP9_9PLEO|nr:hypothetical protein P154DRAFT_560937 [Amniculicola lignicola CBS 123094]